MKIKSTIIVAAAAGSAVTTHAQAADLPAKAPKMVPAPIWNWTGLYVGGHLGAAWQQNGTTGSYFTGAVQFPFSNSTNYTAFAGGAQIGYNWQSGALVYGLEADFTGFSSGPQGSQTVTLTLTETSTNDIRWIGTVRGRLGMTFNGNILAYATGGFAYGRVKSTNTEAIAGISATWQNDSLRTGYAVGGGIEYMFSPHWTIRGEGIYVNLGEKTVSDFTGVCAATCQPVTFKNSATIARAAVNYKF